MKASAASANDCAISRVCVMSSRRRLSVRSATSPPHAPNSSTGPNWHTTRNPIATPLWVRSRTSRVNAIVVSHVPAWEISWPLKNRRKLRFRNARKVVRNAARRRGALTRRSPCGALDEPLQDVRRAAARHSTSSGGRSCRRVASQAVRSMRFFMTWRWPAGVMCTRDTRRSVSSCRRSTKPMASSLSTALVVLGGATCSRTARSPSVSGPSRSTVASAALSVGARLPASWWRRIRARRVTDRRSRPANSNGSEPCATFVCRRRPASHGPQSTRDP